MLSRVRATGSAGSAVARLAGGGSELLMTASLFRQDNTPLFLVRVSAHHGPAPAAATAGNVHLVNEVVMKTTDGFVITDNDGRIEAANPAFIDMVQLATEEQVRGESLGRWLGRPGVDLNVLLANLRQHGTIRLYATSLRGDYGSSLQVEISAVAVEHAGQKSLGFTMRNIGRRIATESAAGRELLESVERLTDQVGRAPLKDLVRETTDIIERLCVEAALKLTGDNRASAAEILGLSRQSLYVKLHRLGLGDLDSDSDR